MVALKVTWKHNPQKNFFYFDGSGFDHIMKRGSNLRHSNLLLALKRSYIVNGFHLLSINREQQRLQNAHLAFTLTCNSFCWGDSTLCWYPFTEPQLDDPKHLQQSCLAFNNNPFLRILRWWGGFLCFCPHIQTKVPQPCKQGIKNLFFLAC